MPVTRSIFASLALSFTAHFVGLDLLAGGVYGLGQGQTTLAPRHNALRVSLDEPKMPSRQARAPAEPALTSPYQASSTRVAGLPMGQDSLYFRGRELTVRPLPEQELDVKSPAFDHQLPVIEIRVRLYISATGVVDHAAIEGDTPAGAFTESVIESLRKAKFSPGRIGDRPVNSQIVLGFRFVAERVGAQQPPPRDDASGQGASRP